MWKPKSFSHSSISVWIPALLSDPHPKFKSVLTLTQLSWFMLESLVRNVGLKFIHLFSSMVVVRLMHSQSNMSRTSYNVAFVSCISIGMWCHHCGSESESEGKSIKLTYRLIVVQYDSESFHPTFDTTVLPLLLWKCHQCHSLGYFNQLPWRESTWYMV